MVLDDHDIPLPEKCSRIFRPSLRGRVEGGRFGHEFHPPLEGGSSRRSRIGEGYVVTFASRLRRQNLKTAFAGHLREEMTDAERVLWAALRSKQVGGVKFRRQQPIGPYVVDFYCAAAKLIVELDGDQHGADGAVAYDEARTRWLMEQGYFVLRFANADVFKNRQVVIDNIVQHIEDLDIPLPGNAFGLSDPPFRLRHGYGGQARGG
jgi:very-short-patch-repair endonuclease